MREEYKMTELGEIPVEWEIKQFSDISKINQGLQIAIEDRFKEMSINRLPYITIQYINDRNNVDNQFYIENANRSVICHKDDILMTRTGNTGVVVTNEHGVFHNNFFKVEYDRNTLVKDFIVYYLNLHKIQALILNYAGTTTIPDLKHKDFYRLPIVIPTLKEQQKIADILSTVDEQIENIESLIEKTKELKKGLMQRLFTKGIGHTEFKETEVGIIPREWEVKSINEVCAEIYRYPTYYGIEYVENGIGEIRGEVLKENGVIDNSNLRYISKTTADKFPRTKLKAGDIVMSVRGTLGKVGFITKELEGCNITANLLRISPNQDIIRSTFFKHLAISELFQQKIDNISTATTIKTFKVPDLKELAIAIPSIKEQKKISEILSAVEEKIEEYEIKKEKLQLLKQGLMQKLLTGKIRVV